MCHIHLIAQGEGCPSNHNCVGIYVGPGYRCECHTPSPTPTATPRNCTERTNVPYASHCSNGEGCPANQHCEGVYVGPNYRCECRNNTPTPTPGPTPTPSPTPRPRPRGCLDQLPSTNQGEYCSSDRECYTTGGQVDPTKICDYATGVYPLMCACVPTPTPSPTPNCSAICVELAGPPYSGAPPRYSQCIADFRLPPQCPTPSILVPSQGCNCCCLPTPTPSPTPPPCADTHPQCNGTCPANKRCVLNGSSCECRFICNTQSSSCNQHVCSTPGYDCVAPDSSHTTCWCRPTLTPTPSPTPSPSPTPPCTCAMFSNINISGTLTRVCVRCNPGECHNSTNDGMCRGYLSERRNYVTCICCPNPDDARCSDTNRLVLAFNDMPDGDVVAVVASLDGTSTETFVLYDAGLEAGTSTDTTIALVDSGGTTETADTAILARKNREDQCSSTSPPTCGGKCNDPSKVCVSKRDKNNKLVCKCVNKNSVRKKK